MSAEMSTVDERDISSPINWVKEKRAMAVVAAMKRRHFQSQFVPDRDAALAAVMALVPDDVSVFRSDSVTLDQMGVVPALRARGTNYVMYPQEKDGQGNNINGDYEKNKDLYFKLQRDVFTADVYISGANAVTMDGKIVSTDGAGNRVAAMIFGPRKVIIVVGVNKIVKDLDDAFDRIHNYCAPINVKRHLDMHNRPWYGELPCASTGLCSDCDHPRRICNYTGILEGALPRMSDRINVILVGEDLGM
jgi:hypothetical protein